MDVEHYRKLVEAAVIDKVELIDGRLVMGEYDLVLSPEQASVARRLGVPVRTCVDAVLEDPDSLIELRERLGEHDTRATAHSASRIEPV